MSHLEDETDPILAGDDITPLTCLRRLPRRSGTPLQFFSFPPLADVKPLPECPHGDSQRQTDILHHTGACVAQPKPAPRWTATERGHLMYRGRVVADMRYANARGRIPFILAALNAAEEKR